MNALDVADGGGARGGARMTRPPRRWNLGRLTVKPRQPSELPTGILLIDGEAVDLEALARRAAENDRWGSRYVSVPVRHFAKRADE